MKLTKRERQRLFALFSGRCAYCGCELPVRGWHADHVEPVMRDSKWVRVEGDPHRTHKMVPTGTLGMPHNERKDNFFPACRACNIDKSCNSIEGWRAQMEDRPNVLRRSYSAYRHAERFGLVAQIETKVVFYFERQGYAVPEPIM